MKGSVLDTAFILWWRATNGDLPMANFNGLYGRDGFEWLDDNVPPPPPPNSDEMRPFIERARDIDRWMSKGNEIVSDIGMTAAIGFLAEMLDQVKQVK